MIRKDLLSQVASPPSEISTAQTALTFTDILFGLVALELFRRLQNMFSLPGFAQWQLFTSAVLIVGSWIGFRRSRKRTRYEIKFFNLPLFCFVVDQVLVFFYFYVLTRIPLEPSASIDPEALTHDTLLALCLIFALYVCWDGLSILIAKAKDHSGPSIVPKYPKVDAESRKTDQFDDPDFVGLGISGAALILFLGLFVIACHAEISEASAKTYFGLALFFLLLYRHAKEINTTFNSAQPHQ